MLVYRLGNLFVIFASTGNKLSWVKHDNDFAYQPLTTLETQRQQYPSCNWPDFDKTLKVGSWEHLEQIHNS